MYTQTNAKFLTLKYYSDSGHGWLAVKVERLEQLGLLDRITHYSYLRGKTAYLEEDCDAGSFLNAAKAAGYTVTLTNGKWCERSTIRSYPGYSAAAARGILGKAA